MTHKGIEMLLVLICHLLARGFYLRVGRRLRICLVLFHEHLLIVELILKGGKLFSFNYGKNSISEIRLNIRPTNKKPPSNGGFTGSNIN